MEGSEGGEEGEVGVDEGKEGACMGEGMAESEAAMGVDGGKGVGEEGFAEGWRGCGMADIRRRNWAMDGGG